MCDRLLCLALLLLLLPLATLQSAHAPSTHTCGIRDVNGNGTSVRPYRLLMTTSDKYLPVLLNWLIYFHELCEGSSLFFVCLDKATETVMKKVGLSCHHTLHMPTMESKNKLWLLRARLTKSLLDEGHDVLMSDSDAIWLQNPFDVLERHSESDIIGSRGSFPEDAAKVLGATLCMGFVYIKSNPKTRNLWGQLVEYMHRDSRPDDQRNLNHLLLARGMLFANATLPLPYLASTAPDTGYVAISGQRRITMPADANRTLQLTLLPHSQFRRICEKELMSAIHEAHVAHCYSEFKTGTGKRGAESKYGLWVLREAWEAVVLPAAGGASDFFRLITDESTIATSGARNATRRLLLPQEGGRGRRRSRFANVCHPERQRGLGANASSSVPAWCHERFRAFGQNVTAADVARMEGRGRRIPRNSSMTGQIAH